METDKHCKYLFNQKFFKTISFVQRVRTHKHYDCKSVRTSFPLRNINPANTMLISTARLLSLNRLDT